MSEKNSIKGDFKGACHSASSAQWEIQTTASYSRCTFSASGGRMERNQLAMNPAVNGMSSTMRIETAPSRSPTYIYQEITYVLTSQKLPRDIRAKEKYPS